MVKAVKICEAMEHAVRAAFTEFLMITTRRRLESHWPGLLDLEVLNCPERMSEFDKVAAKPLLLMVWSSFTDGIPDASQEFVKSAHQARMRGGSC